MNDWWNSKKAKTRKHRRKDGDRYTFVDFLMDVLFWIPEIIVIPFRLIGWLFRGLWKWFDFI